MGDRVVCAKSAIAALTTPSYTDRLSASIAVTSMYSRPLKSVTVTRTASEGGVPSARISVQSATRRWKLHPERQLAAKPRNVVGRAGGEDGPRRAATNQRGHVLAGLVGRGRLAPSESVDG